MIIILLPNYFFLFLLLILFISITISYPKPIHSTPLTHTHIQIVSLTLCFPLSESIHKSLHLKKKKKPQITSTKPNLLNINFKYSPLVFSFTSLFFNQKQTTFMPFFACIYLNISIQMFNKSNLLFNSKQTKTPAITFFFIKSV